MQIKLLQDIVGNVAGKPAAEIVELLAGKKNVNEFILAKKLKLTINQTRNILYKLSDAGLVSFTRKKDKRKGWYTYFWTLNMDKALELLEKNVSGEIDNLKNQLKNRESKRYYFCKTCKVEVNEETALLHNFVCNECGEVYELESSSKIINELNSMINKLTSSLSNIREELGKIKEKEMKKREKEEKKLAKKKKKKKKKKHEEKVVKKKKKKKARKKKVKMDKKKKKKGKRKTKKKISKKKSKKKSGKKKKKVKKKRR